MKKYKYNAVLPFVTIDTDGVRLKITKGDIVAFDGKSFCTEYGRKFALKEKDLVYFSRFYTESENEIFDKLHRQAAVAAMQGLLSDSTTIAACFDVGIDREICIAKSAVAYADALIKELKENYDDRL